MGIMSMIREKKKAFRELQSEKYKKKAMKLQSLKQERTRLEGHKKIRDMEQEELRKIAELKSETGLRKMVSGTASVLKKGAEKIRVRKEKISKQNKKMGGNNPFETERRDIFDNVENENRFSPKRRDLFP